MKARVWSKMGFILILSTLLLSLSTFWGKADEVKYIYDDLGRLYQVIDQRGNVVTFKANLASLRENWSGTGEALTFP